MSIYDELRDGDIVEIINEDFCFIDCVGAKGEVYDFKELKNKIDFHVKFDHHRCKTECRGECHITWSNSDPLEQFLRHIKQMNRNGANS